MARYLITGRSGTGKSTINIELVKRGLTSFDGDAIVPKMARWIDRQSGLPVKVDYTQTIDPQYFSWNWDKAIFNELLNDNSELFLCGSADNQHLFYARFDKVFALALEPVLQHQRITSRTAHNYGKQPGMLELIVKEQKRFMQQAVEYGATVIDASQPPEMIVNQILEQL